jgi:hypothetical protein
MGYPIEQLSIDLSNYCSKQCSFCYNHSRKEGSTLWTPDEVIAFAKDCIAHGVKAISLGGGEPFEYDGLFDVIDALFPLCYLTVTTNGLHFGEGRRVPWDMLASHKPDKIHISLHNPGSQELSMVIRECVKLSEMAIKPGCNLLVSKSSIDDCIHAYGALSRILKPDQIILIPLRFGDTPTPKELALVTGGQPFQSPSCLLKCQRPQKFVSVSWDKKVNSCSYAGGKQPIASLDYQGLEAALEKVQFKSCMSDENE